MKARIVCPRCMGNGYIKIPNESVDIPKEVVAQCTMCESKGEIDEIDEPNNANDNSNFTN
tara:strand:+ start:405 stop:584 length:180 start_codon:yes stop_codon:yes gene_type:complete